MGVYDVDRIYLNDDNLREITSCINYANYTNINPLWVAMETDELVMQSELKF